MTSRKYEQLYEKYNKVRNNLKTSHTTIYSTVVTQTRNGGMDPEVRKNTNETAIPVRVPVKRKEKVDTTASLLEAMILEKRIIYAEEYRKRRYKKKVSTWRT
jgi:hypothetical protein